MNDSQTFTVPEGGKEMRVDRFLSKQLPMHSRTRIQDVIRQGLVLRNGVALRPSEILRPGDSVTWQEPDAVPCTTAEPEDIPLDILYEDEELIVLNKPAGMVVHPGAGNRENTLVSALLFHSGSLSKIGGEERPGIVHRLDKERAAASSWRNPTSRTVNLPGNSPLAECKKPTSLSWRESPGCATESSTHRSPGIPFTGKRWPFPLPRRGGCRHRVSRARRRQAKS